MRENTKKENNNRRVFARFTGLLIALVMFASSFAAFEGAVKVSAATTTTVTIGEVTISGTVGTPLKEQTFEITVENGKLDPVALYVGKDISDYFQNGISIQVTVRRYTSSGKTVIRMKAAAQGKIHFIRYIIISRSE